VKRRLEEHTLIASQDVSSFLQKKTNKTQRFKHVKFSAEENKQISALQENF